MRNLKPVGPYVLSLLSLALPTAAQTAGSADLRYHATTTDTLGYISEVTIEAADSAASRYTRVRFDLVLQPEATGIHVRIVPRERMSSTSRLSILPEPTELVITARGPAVAGAQVTQTESAAALGDSPLLYLPGRVVRLHESWTDTLSFAGRQNTTAMTVRSTIRGSYDRDTTVSGRTLNVIRFASVDLIDITSEFAGQPVQVSLRSERTEHVLWDSRRHRVVQRDATRTMTTTRTLIGGEAREGALDIAVAPQRSRTVWRLVE